MSGLVFMGCEHSGNMARPWAEAGDECICVDLNPDRKDESFPSGGIIRYVKADLITYLPPRRNYKFAAFFPACTNMAVSGARWFRDKGLAGLADGIRLVERCQELAEWMECPYMIENPVGVLSTYWREPDYIFQPWMYGHMEQKATCLWTGGGFVMPEAIYSQKPSEVRQSIWRMPPSADRGRLRSITPEPFARAVFQANCTILPPAAIESSSATDTDAARKD